MQQYLDQQADAIEHVLHTNGINARVAGGSLSPRLAHFHLQLPPRVRFSQLTALLEQIAIATSATALRLAIDTETGLPTIEMPRPDPAPVRLLELAHQAVNWVPPCTATLGTDTTGVPLHLRVDGAEVGSVLISGDSESGKSELIKTIAMSLALHNGPDSLHFLPIDLSGPARRARKNGTWTEMAALPHMISDAATDLIEARARLHWVARTIDRRAESRAEGRPVVGSNLVVLIDGADAAIAGREGAELEAILWKIATEGNSLGIHLICTTRSVRGLDKIPWGARLVGHTSNGIEARMATGIGGSGAEGLVGAGDFLIILGGHVIRFQVASIKREEIDVTVRTLHDCHEDQKANERAAQWAAQAPVPAARPRRSNAGWQLTGTGN